MDSGEFFSALKDRFPDIVEMKDGTATFKMYVAGNWIGNSSKPVKDPDNNSVLCNVSIADLELVDKALDSAREKKETMKSLSGDEKIAILEKAADLLKASRELFVTALVKNVGKPIKEAEGEVDATIERIRRVKSDSQRIQGDFIPGEWAKPNRGRIAIVLREPVGVVLAIAPFNMPLFISYTKVIPALLAGNTVILRPPSLVPIAPIMMGKILEEAGLPAGALNIIPTATDVASYLATRDEVDMITFTGSTEVGLKLTKISGIKRIHLELGGKAAALVMKDCGDIKSAAQNIVAGSTKFSGQRCDAISRVLVHSTHEERLTREIVTLVRKLKTGDPFSRETDIGPLIDSRAVDRVDGLVKDAVEKGARILVGGKSSGNYFKPTVLSNVPLSAKIMWEETFGPIIPIHSFSDEEEAVDIINSSEYGLDNAIFTDDIRTAWRLGKKLESGEISINCFPSHGIGFFPFGGVKKSGLGREGISYSIDEFTNLKTVVYNIE